MTPRFICPYCHHPIDPQTLEAASGVGLQYRICPDCDRPLLLASAAPPAKPLPAPTIGILPSAVPSAGSPR